MEILVQRRDLSCDWRDAAVGLSGDERLEHRQPLFDARDQERQRMPGKLDKKPNEKLRLTDEGLLKIAFVTHGRSVRQQRWFYTSPRFVTMMKLVSLRTVQFTDELS